MRIYIIGPSASGKTTLATLLSQRLALPHHQLDSIFFDFQENKKGKIKLPTNVITDRLKDVLNKDKWIIEGIQTIPSIALCATKIIYLKIPMHVCIVRQWKRFITSEEQRKKYGLLSNLKNSKSIVYQFRGDTTEERYNDMRCSLVSKSEIFIKEYSNKLIIFENHKTSLKDLHNLNID